MRTLHILCSVFLAAPFLLAQRFPEVEPNNNAATAQPFAMGTQIDADLAAAEQDWFRFTTAGGQVRVFTSGVSVAALDTQIEVRDSTGTVVLAFNDDSRSLNSDVTINLAAGTYYLMIDGFSAATAGTYTLDIGELPAKPFTAVEAEPNDNLASAQPIAHGAQIDGSLSGAADQDWYSVVVTAPRAGVWIQVTEGGVPWVSQHRLEFYDAAGVLLNAATLGTNAIDSSTTTYRNSQIRCWPAGTYHLVVRNRSVPPGTNPNPTGRYRLEYIEMPMNTGGVIPEGAEPNSTVATATPLAQGQRGIGNISISTGPDANDWWGPIVLSSPAVLMFQTAQTGATPIQDTTINIRNYDPILNALGPASAATSGNILDPTSHARGTFLFNLAPNTYYLEVVSPGTAATQAGDYALELSIAQNNPYVAGAYAFATVNTSCLGSNGQRPTISTDNTRELPVLGTTFSRTLGAMQPGAVFFVLQGLDFHFANGGTTPLPFNLAFFGAPNCSIHVDPAVSTLGIGGPAGTAVLNQATPPVLALRGLPIYEQAAVLDLPANPLGLTVSNYARQILGERSY